MRRTVRRLADGREIIYFDTDPSAPERTAVDHRDLPAQAPASELRQDPLTGDWVILAAHRQARTYKPPADLCPLCPTAEGRPSEIPEPSYDVVVFENRFPSLAEKMSVEPATVDGGLVPARPAIGRCEVVCFTPDHDASFGELSPRQARTVVDAWADRTAELARIPGVEQVFCFENRGEEIGVTLHHPHGQIYAYSFLPPRTQQKLRVSETYLAEHGRHVLEDVLNAERAAGVRVVAESTHWIAIVPAAARWPVEVHLAPRRHVSDIPGLTAAERDDFATTYLEILRRLDRIYSKPLPYVAAWHQAPVHSDRELSWLHLEVFSVRRSADKLKYLAGSESGMAVWINDMTPEQVAGRLRAR